MKWIKYQIVCGKNENGEDILLNKKIGYSDENLAIAKTEAHNGECIIEEDSESFDKEPLGIEFGGTGATNADSAREKLNAQKKLGFTPVQQGGIANHGDNKVYIGWSTENKLNVQVDSTNLGNIITDSPAYGVILPVNKGGTGAKNALDAMTNLKGVPIIDAQGASYDMNVILDTGVLGWYKFNVNTLNTAYKEGKTGNTAGYIFNIPTGKTSGTRYGYQLALHIGDPNLYIRAIYSGTPTAWRKNLGAAADGHTHDFIKDISNDVTIMAGLDGGVTPIISALKGGQAEWAIGGYTGNLRHLVVHHYEDGDWNGNSIILDSTNYKDVASYKISHTLLWGGNAGNGVTVSLADSLNNFDMFFVSFEGAFSDVKMVSAGCSWYGLSFDIVDDSKNTVTYACKVEVLENGWQIKNTKCSRITHTPGSNHASAGDTFISAIYGVKIS